MFVYDADVQAVPLCLSQDALMLSGEESTWRRLKEALPTLEGLKEKSGILYGKDPQRVSSFNLCFVGGCLNESRLTSCRHFLPL